MNKIILVVTIILGLVVISCNQNKKSETEKTTKQTEANEPKAESPTIEDKIISSSITNKVGDKLEMTYNNTKKTATLIFKGETIDLKQDTMGSGIKYSNKKYVFSEWHGQTELKKDGKSIFKNTDDSKASAK